MPVFAALYILNMHVAVVALQRRIARGVAILAPRRSQHAIYLDERRLRRRRIRLWRAGCARSAQQEHSGGEKNGRQRQDSRSFHQKSA